MSFFTIKMTFMSAEVIRNSYSVKKDRWSMCRFHLIHTFLRKSGGHGCEGWWGKRPGEVPRETECPWVPTYYLTPESSGHVWKKGVPVGENCTCEEWGEGAMMSTLSLPSPQFLKMQTVSYIDFIQKMKRGSPWKKAGKGDQPHVQARTIIMRAFRDS